MKSIMTLSILLFVYCWPWFPYSNADSCIDDLSTGYYV